VYADEVGGHAAGVANTWLQQPWQCHFILTVCAAPNRALQPAVSHITCQCVATRRIKLCAALHTQAEADKDKPRVCDRLSKANLTTLHGLMDLLELPRGSGPEGKKVEIASADSDVRCCCSWQRLFRELPACDTCVQWDMERIVYHFIVISELAVV
jgi:hypothetical protein